MKLMNDRAAAEFLGVSRKHMQTMRTKGKGPKFCKIGGAVRYNEADLIKYVQDRTIDPAKQ